MVDSAVAVVSVNVVTVAAVDVVVSVIVHTVNVIREKKMTRSIQNRNSNWQVTLNRFSIGYLFVKSDAASFLSPLLEVSKKKRRKFTQLKFTPIIINKNDVSRPDRYNQV